MTHHTPTVRADVTTKRTYCRPQSNGKFENWEQVVDRSIQHQAWLWDRALGKEYEAPEYHAWNEELDELRNLMMERKVSLAGRTLWLGGTDVSKTRESSQFNCTFTRVQTIHDVVDSYWLLLQGCGVGFYPSIGTLSGFSKYIPELEIVPGKTDHKKGVEQSLEHFDNETKVWSITIGDSAEAWAKSVGKILAGKVSAKKLILDFSRIRGAGFRLSGYGWLSVGYKPLAEALTNIFNILNRRSAQLLTELDILDILNHLGTTISTRRSAEIAVLDYNSPNWKLFANAKKDLSVTPHRQQSNNSLIFWDKPNKEKLDELFNIIRDSGGCEPGFINGEAARKRAPWFKGVNPCGEILLGDKTFCNLVEVNLAAFKENRAGLERAIWLVARANYRQTCVDLDDGILQRTWHENNEFLRLCGVGITGIALCKELSEYDYRTFSRIATLGAYSMADELDLPRPKNVTTVKPSGTLSKVMDTTEGCHSPKGKYIFNNIKFAKDDEILPVLKNANYNIFDDPSSDHTSIVTFPVTWDELEYDYCTESAISQLEKYRKLMNCYVDHNCSITVSYGEDEVEDIKEWLLKYWDDFVGVSWMPRINPELTAKDLGFPYLPQEVVNKETYDAYVSKLEPVDITDINVKHIMSTITDNVDDECDAGQCPIL